MNQRAYYYRYKNLDSSCSAAWLAYEQASLYTTGKAEACNNIGFCSFMQMDFEVAERMFRQVYALTNNELELLIADIGMMKIYQRAAMNKEFYDYRNTALGRIRRIDEDKNLFIDRHERIRLNFAYTEFSIVSAIYYYYLQQMPQAISSINEIKPEIELAGDTNQLLYYYYIRGSAGLSTATDPDRRRLDEFDDLLQAWRMASQGGYTYFEGNGLQGLANLMASPDNFRFFLERRSHAMSQFGFPVDSLMPLEMARAALDKFKEYHDIYQIAGAYVSIGRYLNEHGRYNEALEALGQALDYVNRHHQLYYPDHHDSLDVLYPYVGEEKVYTELTWIQAANAGRDAVGVKTVPEWISRIREQLSVSYAGLGMTEQSAYNRNIYLEILKLTRQDKELDSRYDVLKRESMQLNVLLLLIFFFILVIIAVFWIFSRRSRKRNQIYFSRLRLALDICQKVTASIPSDISGEEDMVSTLKSAILADMKTLVGATDIEIRLFTDNEEGAHYFDLYVPDKERPVGTLRIIAPHKLTKDEQALVHIIAPYIAWTLDSGMTFISLGDERDQLEKQRYIHEQHIARNKRENLIKKSCLAIVNGIIPYIDRIINEVHKLKEKKFAGNDEIKLDKYQYINELVTTINEYNDILALWIKMKQGTISLNIENFALEELFALVGKGRKTFDMKRQTFELEETALVVKADKALTLFMINTLTENARKYTPRGGTVKLYARQEEGYVEISVEDNGIGLSAADVALIQDEKVYNSSQIGMTGGNANEELKRAKGSGFGLMNCKGIIEKYRKTNKLFEVCRFSVESQPGKGSRFYFRLPAGVRKTLGVLLCLLLPFGFMSCSKPAADVPGTFPSDSLSAGSRKEYGRLLVEAGQFADTAYYCNVMYEFDLALQYVDSAMDCLNRHYRTYSPAPHVYMSLKGEGTPAEQVWWREMFESDYPVIYDLRNTAAVSFLALKNWPAYSYNNRAYTTMYKLTSEDSNLEAYCLELERSTTNKVVGIILCILLLVSSLIGYYVLYVRKRLANRWNLEQVLDINKRIFSSSLIRAQESVEALQREENAITEIPQKIVSEAFDAMNELLGINTFGLAVHNESKEQLEYASYPGQEPLPDIVQKSFEQRTYLCEANRQVFPLIVETAGTHRCVGALYLEQAGNTGQEVDHLLLELISRNVAIVVFNAIVKLAVKYRDIESAYEDTYRASWEDSMLHVQNMVLDNCLSTIKHETIYYPNKIKQIIGKLADNKVAGKEEDECMEAIYELIEYYKGIFTILSSNASRQLEEVTFRRVTIPVAALVEYAGKYLKKMAKGRREAVYLSTGLQTRANVLGDANQLHFLLENLIDEALSVHLPGELRLQVLDDGGFVRFLFTDTRREKSAEELNHLFYPDLARMTSGEKGELRGTEYLVCKQIIRDHDEFAGYRGCRINAEPAVGGGFTVYFTIPKR